MSRASRIVKAFLGVGLVAACASAPPPSPKPKPAVFLGSRLPRGVETIEELDVRWRGARYRYRLAWADTPATTCEGDNLPCTCEGFEGSKAGHLLLEQVGPAEGESAPQAAHALLDLGALNTNLWQSDEEPGSAALTGLGALPRSPKSAPAMGIDDFDRDGERTEFIWRLRSSTCGHGAFILLGMFQGKLTFATTEAHPERPLVLDSADDFRTLMRNGALDRVFIHCFEHGTDHEERYQGTLVGGVYRIAVRKTSCLDRSEGELEAL
jgi:hypothetical protein